MRSTLSAMRKKTFLDVGSCHVASKNNGEKEDAKFEGNHEKKESVGWCILYKASASKGRWTYSYLVAGLDLFENQ